MENESATESDSVSIIKWSRDIRYAKNTTLFIIQFYGQVPGFIYINLIFFLNLYLVSAASSIKPRKVS